MPRDAFSERVFIGYEQFIDSVKCARCFINERSLNRSRDFPSNMHENENSLRSRTNCGSYGIRPHVPGGLVIEYSSADSASTSTGDISLGSSSLPAAGRLLSCTCTV